VDVIVEPFRKGLIPFFDEVKTNALNAGALGAGISGSGPTIFALCKGEKSAKEVYEAIESTYKKTGIGFEMFISKINPEGMKIIK
jgi:homoserine kinase